MSSLTDYLKLFKWDLEEPEDLNSEFNIQQALNTNWDKIDLKVKELANNSEKKHNHYKITITEVIEKETEYEIPFNFVVGNDEFEIYYNNEYLIREKSANDEANYKEVGTAGSTSNKVIFGWDLRVGDVLDFIVKGVVANEENENQNT